jgi:vacuolar iron transporter family protein
MFKCSIMKGFGFGLASGVITTLGLMVGLNSSTHSYKVVVGGILVIAIADAFSDALGIHISEEAENKHTTKEIWEATIGTFVSKFIFSAMFIIPVLFFSLKVAIIVSIVWGLFLIGLFSFYMARQQKTKHYEVIGEHLGIAILVIIITHYVGVWVSSLNNHY